MSRRIAAIDRLRGLVIVLMALDHCRDFFQPAGIGPENLDTTFGLFFFTRWVTHFCAPVFVLLAGAGARLYSDKVDDPGETARWLLTRGLWLMFLEVTWITGAWFFGWPAIHLGVVWGIGGAMLLLAGCVTLPGRVVGIVGATLTVLLAAVAVPGDWALGFLFQPGYFPDVVFGRGISNVYVVIPWFAVMAMGWGLAPLLADPERRGRLLGWGAAAFLGFVVLRALNGFGDPRPWAPHPRGAWVTMFDFLNASKYPPSLDYLLMTLGPALAFLPTLSRWRGIVGTALQTFGQVPLFFYLLHLPGYHLAGVLHAQVRFEESTIPGSEPLSLGLIWGVWIVGLLALYPLCVWWRGVKRRRPYWWVAYL